MAAYLSEMIPAPDRLDALHPYLAGLISGRRRSLYSEGQRRAALLAGASTSADFAARVCRVYTSFPDANDVERTESAIHLYLLRLIAPDDFADAREVIQKHLNIEGLDETAQSLAELAVSCPEIATALLELRCGRAALLLQQKALEARDNRGSTAEFDFYSSLIEDTARLRIAYFLRAEAMKAAAQIHAPFNWSALDDLDKFKAAGSLRFFTLIAELKQNLRLLKHALYLYKEASHRPIVSGVLAYNPVAQCGTVTATFAGLNLSVQPRAFKNLDIEARARVQLALWRGIHGEQLDLILSATIDHIVRYVALFERALGEAEAKWEANKIVGNLDRANAGARLFEAVAEAVEWTAEPIVPKGEDEDWEAPSSLQLHRNPLALAIETAIQRFKDPSVKIAIPVPRKGTAEAKTNLFAAMRLAFLEDDEALPIKLRTVVDKRTGEELNSRFHQRLADAREEGRYTFGERWEAWNEQEADRANRLAQNATPKQKWEAERCRSDASRGTDPSRKPGGVLPRGFYQGRDALRGAIIQGFVVA